MKILLTGDPHSGKSTLLEKLVSKIIDKQGFLTREVAKDGQRTGFDLESTDGRRIRFADISSLSKCRVSSYGVDVEVLDEFIGELPAIKPGATLYLDEIGQMQLLSSKFRYLTERYLDADNDFVGTISKVYENDLISSIKKNLAIEIIELTLENRNKVTEELLRRFGSIND